jgi:hypothetical protein
VSAVEAVKRWLRAEAAPVSFPNGNAIAVIREQEEAKKALAEFPALPAPSSPYYASMDEGQCGIVISDHLTDKQMESVPLHIALEVLDDLNSGCDLANWGADPEHRRRQVLAAYGPQLAELVCQAVDEALESRSEGHKRLKDYDGKKTAPLSSDEIDEPFYEDCAADAEYASPTTSFDFWGAIEAARELIEERDSAATKVRRGQALEPVS